MFASWQSWDEYKIGWVPFGRSTVVWLFLNYNFSTNQAADANDQLRCLCCSKPYLNRIRNQANGFNSSQLISHFLYRFSFKLSIALIEHPIIIISLILLHLFLLTYHFYASHTQNQNCCYVSALSYRFPCISIDSTYVCVVVESCCRVYKINQLCYNVVVVSTLRHIILSANKHLRIFVLII